MRYFLSLSQHPAKIVAFASFFPIPKLDFAMSMSVSATIQLTEQHNGHRKQKREETLLNFLNVFFHQWEKNKTVSARPIITRKVIIGR